MKNHKPETAFATIVVLMFTAFAGVSVALGVHIFAGWAVGIAVYYLLHRVFILPHLQQHKRWESRPPLEAYLSKHPNCKHRKGISCFNCNSGSIRNWGVNGANDPRRLHICNHCNTTLYRSETSA